MPAIDMTRRFVIQWDSDMLYEQVKKQAQEAGEYSDDHDDWFDPDEIVDQIELPPGTTLQQATGRAKLIASKAKYGTAVLSELVDEDGTWLGDDLIWISEEVG